MRILPLIILFMAPSVMAQITGAGKTHDWFTCPSGIRAYNEAACVTPPSEPAAGATIQDEDFETGNWDTYGWSTSGNAPIVNTDVSCTGTKAMRLDLDFDDVTNNYRTEVVVNNIELSTKNFNPNETYWLGLAIYIPADWDTSGDVGGDIMLQFHGDKDAAEPYRNPPFALSARQGVWKATWKADSNATSASSSSYTNSSSAFMSDMVLGAWTTFAIEIYFDYNNGGSGHIGIWINGTQELNVDSAVGYNDTKGPYLKMGNYKSEWKESNWGWGGASTFSTRLSYIDDIKIGDATAERAGVEPDCS